MPNVYVIGREREYEDMFIHMGWGISKDLDGADVIQFTGGADVNPQLYNETLHPRSNINAARDDMEKEIFDKYYAKKHMAGICRGGQFLNVMCGGKMYQHQSGHPYIHRAWVYSKMLSLNVSSTHHQVMIPNVDKGIVLMAANEGILCERMDGDKIVQEAPDWETESILYGDDGVLCFQPHPEHALRRPDVKDCMNLYFSFLEDLLYDVQ